MVVYKSTSNIPSPKAGGQQGQSPDQGVITLQLVPGLVHVKSRKFQKSGTDTVSVFD